MPPADDPGAGAHSATLRGKIHRMRVVFSLGALLLALWLVSRLVGLQFGTMVAVPAPGSGATSATAAQKAAARVQEAIDLGAARRADDAASR